MYQLPVNNLARIRRARKQVKKTLGDIGLELCKEAVEDFKDFCPDEQFVQGTLCLDLCSWDPSYSKTQVYRSKPFCCTECSFSSKYYSGYKNHFRNVHRKIFESILLNCPYCTFTASRKSMEIHIRIFHQSRLPQPSAANAMQPYATSQQSAMRQKEPAFLGRGRQPDSMEKPVYYCKKCTFRDSLYNVVRRHIYREHFQHVVSPYLAMAPNPSVKNGVSNTILCKRCQFSTRSYEAIVQHVVEYHERIGAQVTAMVGHANLVVNKPQASPLTSQRVPVIANRAPSLPTDLGVQPVIGYLKPNVAKNYSPNALNKARILPGKTTLAENNVPLVNTAQTQKWKICTVCNELFPENLYSAHFESAHKAKKVWALAKYIMKIHNFTSKCLLCNRYLPSDTLLNHVLIHGLTCPQCHSAFHSVEKLIEHGTMAHLTPFDGPPGASPLTFDLALKQDKSSNVQLLVLTFNTNESVNGQDDTLLHSLGLTKVPTPNMFEKKGQPLAKNALPSLSRKHEMGKTLCPLCFTILKGPISDALSLHLRQRHQVLQTMHPVEKKLTYKCIHCLGVYTSNMVASTITLHLVQCRAVGRSQGAVAIKPPLNLGASGAGLLKRQLPMQATSNPKKMKMGKDLVTSSTKVDDVDLVLDPSNYEHKTYEARKEFLTAYFNRRPYVSTQEKEKLSAKLWLWKADIASHFSIKQRMCEKHCNEIKASVLLGFDMNALKTVKHDLIFESSDPRTTTMGRNTAIKSRLPNPVESKSETVACMETISIDSDSETEVENKPGEHRNLDPKETPVNQIHAADTMNVEKEDASVCEKETLNETNECEQEMTGVEKYTEDKMLLTKETEDEMQLTKEAEEEMQLTKEAEEEMQLTKEAEEEMQLTKEAEEEMQLTKETENELLLTKETEDELLLAKETEDELLLTKETEDELQVTKETEDELLFTKATEDELLFTKETEDELLFTKETEDELLFTKETEDELLFTKETEDELLFTKETEDELLFTKETEDELLFTKETEDELQFTNETEDEMQFTKETQCETIQIKQEDTTEEKCVSTIAAEPEGAEEMEWATEENPSLSAKEVENKV